LANWHANCADALIARRVTLELMMNNPDFSGSSTDKLDTVPDTASPAYADRHLLTRPFDKFASLVTRWAGSPVAFGLAVLTVVAWVLTGPIFHYSDGWQLVINTGTTIVTFLMVFLIQQSQNKDSVALHLKLNELLSSHRAASNRLIGIEDASEEELRRLAAAYLRLSTNSSEIDTHAVKDRP
jgi:low affinity Fe/Cu permease